MSFFPSPMIVRLQDLKLWQGNYDSLLQSKSRDITNASDYDTIEGVSALDSTKSTPFPSPERNENIDWDKKAISPAKPFEELLEEKLAEDKPSQAQRKPKRPFLKKGAGLARYKLTRSDIAKYPKRNVQRKLSEEKLNEPIEISEEKHSKPPNERFKKNFFVKDKQVEEKFETAPIPKKSCLKTSVNVIKEPESVYLTPLKMPDLAIKPKATWHKVLEEDNDRKDVKEDATKKISDETKTPSKSQFNSQIIEKINEFALRHFLPNSPKRYENERNHDLTNSSAITTPGSQILYERALENELRIFETLEERVENSSFSSTNSSIIRLLSSTPNKIKMPLKQSPILEEKKVLLEENTHLFPQGDNHFVSIHQKLQEVNKKSEVLQGFLNNLKKLEDSNVKARNNEAKHIVQAGILRHTPDTSFSDEEKWSSNTDSRSQSPTIGYTDTETTFKDSTSIKVDVAVNTSFNEKEECSQIEKCVKCEELQKKIDKINKELPNVQEEKARVCDFAKDLEKKRDQLNREILKMKKHHEEEVSELNDQLEIERKKFSKEKLVFDMYLKDAQDRPSKKVREELSNLKKELTDVKELMKLKETKNGATQARLRNQIKQLEKENIELKTNVEKLQKENAKLNASQKVRRPSEVKMLHEINKNLSKLTEETFKKQLTKSEVINTQSHEEDESIIKNVNVKNSKHITNISRETTPVMKKRQHSCLKKRVLQDEQSSNINESSNNDITSFVNLSLEKQYENVFGQFPSPGPINNTLNDSKKEKTERIFEDGSKEIRYSNGNSKVISPDGNLISVKYYNGDIKETNLLNNTLKYFYAENETWHTQFGDGSELLEYPNGQKERTYPNGKKEVTCPDGSFLTKLPDGTEEIVYPDGSKMVKNLLDETILLLPNGQREVHTKDHKRREYPDGTVKILYPDGVQETRYASGRVRIKGADGVLIMDS